MLEYKNAQYKMQIIQKYQILSLLDVPTRLIRDLLSGVVESRPLSHWGLHPTWGYISGTNQQHCVGSKNEAGWVL